MTRKWIVVFVLVAALAACKREKGPEIAPAPAPAPAPTPVEKSVYVIGVSYQNLAFPYVAALQRAAQNEARRLGVVRLIETDAMNDTGKELDNVQRLLSQKIDCLAFEAASLDASVASIEAANRTGVPVVQFNGRANGGDYVTFVGSNQRESGELLGKWLADFYRRSGQERLRGIYLRGMPGQVTDLARNDGFKSELQKEGLQDKIELTEQYADYDRGKGQSVTESILSRDKNFSFILANNDDMILGALQAAEQFGLSGQIQLVGVDGLPETLNAILAGKIAATVFQNPEAQGAGGVQACYRHLKGDALPKEMLIPFELVTQENVVQYLDLANRVYVR